MLLLFKVKIGTLVGALAGPLMAVAFTPIAMPPSSGADETLRLAPSSFSYRVAGDFSRDGKPVESPLRDLRLPEDLHIMKRQVTVAEYMVCVDHGACARLAGPLQARDAPVTGVSWHDASAYAAWVSHRTGAVHRLPTDEEWTFAAAEKVRDEALPLVDPADPSQAWIARYEAESNRSRPTGTTPQPGGTFGTNTKGLDDLAGNIWEWTDNCFVRVALDGDREQVTNTNCGVRVVEGAHRAYMTDFIRDPKSGGCAAGIPPSNLGFRLVVEQPATVVAGAVRNVAKILRRS